MDIQNMTKLDSQVEKILYLISNPYDRKEFRRMLKFWKTKMNEQLSIIEYFVEECLTEEKISKLEKDDLLKFIQSIYPIRTVNISCEKVNVLVPLVSNRNRLMRKV